MVDLKSREYGLLCRCNALKLYCCGHGCNAMNESRMQCNDITQDTTQQCIIRHIALMQDKRHYRDAMQAARMQYNDIM